MNNNTKGILYVILAATSFGILPILAKLAYSQGADTYTVLSLRFLMASIILLYYLWYKKISLKIGKKQILLVILVGAFGYSATALTMFLSYKYITSGLATMILYTYPAIVTLLSFLIYKEKFYSRKVISLLLSILGVYSLVGFRGAEFNVRGVLLALAGAFLYSFYVIGISHSEIKKINTYVMTFYVSFISFVVMTIIGTASSQLNLNINFYSLVCIIVLAFISTVVALMAFLQGVRLIGPSKASILSTLEPIVSLIFGIIILGEQVSIGVVIGSIFIIVSVLVLTREDSVLKFGNKKIKVHIKKIRLLRKITRQKIGKYDEKY